MKATIAAQACVLLLGIRDHDLYAGVPSIIVHRGTFSRPAHTLLEGGAVLEDQEALLGEAWYRGPVVLAWDSVLGGTPALIGMSISDAFYLPDGDGIIDSAEATDPKRLHAVVGAAVGEKQGKKFLLVRNSWARSQRMCRSGRTG